jgi:hypothetical protein
LWPHAVCCPEDVAAGRKLRETGGVSGHEILQFVISTLTGTGESTRHVIGADREPSRIVPGPEPGAVYRISVVVATGRLEADAEQADSVAFTVSISDTLSSTYSSSPTLI